MEGVGLGKCLGGGGVGRTGLLRLGVVPRAVFQGAGFRVQGLGFRIENLRFRV